MKDEPTAIRDTLLQPCFCSRSIKYRPPYPGKPSRKSVLQHLHIVHWKGGVCGGTCALTLTGGAATLTIVQVTRLSCRHEFAD